MPGQLWFAWFDDELLEDEPVDADALVEVEDVPDGVAVAACAIAAPPPISAPERVRAMRARVMWFLMLGITSFLPFR
jgi:hypothetical protein